MSLLVGAKFNIQCNAVSSWYSIDANEWAIATVVCGWKIVLIRDVPAPKEQAAAPDRC